LQYAGSKTLLCRYNGVTKTTTATAQQKKKKKKKQKKQKQQQKKKKRHRSATSQSGEGSPHSKGQASFDACWSWRGLPVFALSPRWASSMRETGVVRQIDCTLSNAPKHEILSTKT
jgi:hypothetical protein